MSEKDFWGEKWAQPTQGFQQEVPNENMVKYFEALNLQGKSILVPLCGSTVDMIWLHERGAEIVGVEFVESAVQKFFADLEVEAEITSQDTYKLYQYENYNIYVMDFFEFFTTGIHAVDYVYDRASLVALKYDLKVKYAEVMNQLEVNEKYFLIGYTYDQSLREGPPFSTPALEIEKLLYTFHVEHLSSHDKEVDFKDITVDVTNSYYQLEKL
jgi:thiopurine S-methyltransferase